MSCDYRRADQTTALGSGYECPIEYYRRRMRENVDLGRGTGDRWQEVTADAYQWNLRQLLQELGL